MVKYYCDPPWSAAWLVSGVRPPGLSATFVVKGTFLLKPGAPAEPDPKPDLVSGDVHEEDDDQKPLRYASDFAPVKLRTDLVLLAKCHAAKGKSAAVLRAGFRVGAWSKSVAVIGNRRWIPGVLSTGQTEPEPFTSMPITWDRAYGGKGFKKNPAGTGRVKDGGDLPNIENADRLLKSPGDGLDPAGFGPVRPDWEPRSSVKGKYDAKWLKERWPWYPEDFDFGVFNGAPRDQQIEGFLKGDEELAFENLHPEHPKYVSRLPGLRARCFLAEKIDGKPQFREVPLHIDSLWIDLEASKLVLVWRGMLGVRTLKMRDLDGILIRAEAMKDPVVPIEQVRAAYEEKSKAEEPPPEKDEPPPLPAQPPPPPKATAEGILAALAAGRVLAEADLSRAQMPGIDLSGRDLHGAVFEGASMAKAKLAGANLEDADLSGADLSEADLSGANLKNADLTRARLDKAVLKKAKLDGAKFERATMAGAVLEECEGKMTSFHCANLRGAKLKKSKFSLSDFSRAALEDADFTGAELKATDIAGASAVGTIFAEADITNLRANSPKTDARKADFKMTKGEKTVWSEAVLDGADFTGAQLPGADFERASLAGTIFKRGDFTGGVFTEAN
ncbi:MAG TPA: DUF2169 domain-containing protein, partial [Planctomycetota bacterium]|nr:DUF2169 domain-containing protein [Planctomycetota bacterium]